jgi:hypothetical protein
MQMLRAPAARGARNKEWYFCNNLLFYLQNQKHHRDKFHICLVHNVDLEKYIATLE